MEQALIKLGLNVYQVAGIIGVLVFILALLVVSILRFYSKRVGQQAAEIREIRDDLQTRMDETLDECKQTCREKDALIESHRINVEELRRQVAVHQRNEVWFKNEIENLQDRLTELEKPSELPTTGSKRKTRRRTPS